jgi:hypothetical protein
MTISSLGAPITSSSVATGEAPSAEATPHPKADHHIVAFEVDADQTYPDGTKSELNA